MWWMLGAVCNAVIAIAYFMIVYAIVRPLVTSRQLRTNALGAATAAIFLTCAVHHGAHVVHMLMPYAGVDMEQGMAMREAWGPELALWDLVGAVVAAYYWSLRGGFGAGSASPQLFKDQVEREQRALELNDTVLQGMVVARMALDLGERKRGMDALDTQHRRGQPDDHRADRRRPRTPRQPPAALLPGAGRGPARCRRTGGRRMSGVALNVDPLEVLVVDDTPDLRDLLTMALERTGEFRVVAHAENGREAIDAARSHDPDLVLLDIAMPVMDGLEALPQVRDACPQAIVVMLSGFGASEMTSKALAGGADGYIQKGQPLGRTAGPAAHPRGQGVQRTPRSRRRRRAPGRAAGHARPPRAGTLRVPAGPRGPGRAGQPRGGPAARRPLGARHRPRVHLARARRPTSTPSPTTTPPCCSTSASPPAASW